MKSQYPNADIVELLGLDISERQVRRIGAKEGDWKLRWLSRIERKEAVDN